MMEPLERAPTRSRLLPRFVTFAVIVVLVVGGLTARLVHLQVARGGHFTELAKDNRVVLQAIPSTRGLIYDRAGRPLVTNVPAYSVKVRPADLPLSRRPDVVGRLARLLDLNPTEINQTLDRNPGSRFDLVRIASDVPADIASVIAEAHLELPGVEVVVESRRSYPMGPLVSKLLGYTGSVTGTDLERLKDEGYLADDALGKAGVEAVYEAELRGTYGVEQVERDATGRKLRVLATVREPVAGQSLELSIDTKTQQTAEKALKWAMDLAGIRRGVVAVMNPQTGEVLAMVSLPSYDNNIFARGISRTEFERLLKDPDQPLLNQAIAEQYPPGSTYKLITGAGGLHDRKITPSTKLETKSYLEIGPYKYREWKRGGWGPLDIYDGFGHSSDTFFYQVAGRLGIDRLAYWAKEFGYGARTGIDLPGEARGTVPSNEWKQGVFGQPIFPGEVYQAGIGQGYDTATPIQVLNSYAALANGGRLLQPQIVRRVLAADGTVVRDFQPKLIRQMDIDPAVLTTMREAARRVLTIRHTSNLVELPLMVAGKSGTAEFGERDEKGRLPFHSWFAAFVPKGADVSKPDAELAVLAFAYDSRTRGNAAVEIVKYFLQLHYDLRDEDGKPIDKRNFEYLQRGNCYRDQCSSAEGRD